MALADFNALKATIESGKPYFFSKNSLTATAAKLMSLWAATPNAGAVPSTPVTCNANTAGAILTEPRLSGLTNAYYVAQLELASFAKGGYRRKITGTNASS